MNYVDISSKDIISSIKEQLDDLSSLTGRKDLKIDRIEWTEEGIRIWLTQKN